MKRISSIILAVSLASDSAAVADPTTTSQVSSPGHPHMCSPRDWYTEAEVLSRMSGTVVLAFRITVDGEVKDPAVVRSSGFQGLDEAAIKCVSTWRYRPAVRDGKS